MFRTSAALKGSDIVSSPKGEAPRSRTNFFAAAIDRIRLIKPLHRNKLENTVGQLKSILNTVRDPKAYELFTRKVLVDEAIEAHARNAVYEQNVARVKAVREAYESYKESGASKELLAEARKVLHDANVTLKQGPQYEHREPGETLKSMEAERARIDRLMTPEVKSAYERHLETVRAYREELIGRGLIAPSAREFYFPHYILDLGKETRGANLPRGRGAAKTRSGSTKQRHGGREWSKDYLTALSRYLTETSEMLARHDMLDEIAHNYHVTANPMDKVLRAPDGGKSQLQLYVEKGIIPDGYRKYTLGSGFTEQRFSSPGERYFGELLDNVLPDIAKKFGIDVVHDVRGILDPRIQRMLESSVSRKRVNDAAPMHGLDVVIPEELANDLTILGAIERKVGALATIEKGQNLFKSLVIQPTPFRYNWRNLVGDMQRAVAQFGVTNMSDARLWRETYKEIKDAYVHRKFSDDWHDAHEYGIMSSGYTAVEANKFGELDPFKHLTGQGSRVNPLRVLKLLTRISHGREDMVRFYIYKMNKQRIERGQQPLLGVLNPDIAKGLARGTEEYPRLLAAISRKALGDYGDFTPSEEFISNTMIPFYRWLKINTSFWFKDLPTATGRALAHTRGPGKFSASDAAVLQGVAVVAAAAVTARMWNWQNDEMRKAAEKLPESTQQTTHLILPDPEVFANTGEITPWRDAEGKPRVIHLNDALDDAIDLIGAGSMMPDVKALIDGRMSGKEFVTRRAEDARLAPINYLYRGMGPLPNLGFALAGIQSYPNVTDARPIPEEKYAQNILGAAGFGSVSGVAEAFPGQVASPVSQVFDIPGQLGFKAVRETRVPGPQNELLLRLNREEKSFNEMMGRAISIKGKLSEPNLSEAQREARVAQLKRILQIKGERMRRLKDRFEALRRTENMQ